MKKLLVAFSFFAATLAFAISVPDPVGYVNDFANIIDNKVEAELDNQLRQYDQETSIEVVVVTVNSLENLTVEDYAQELVQRPRWKVGKAGKNNGVVLLVAPNERKMRIHTGYGIEPDLTDLQAGRIIREEMIPEFKQGNMIAGIAAGVKAIIRELGNKPYEQRVAERKVQEEKARKERELAAIRVKAFLHTLVIAAIPITILVLIGIGIYSWHRRRQKIKEAPKLLAGMPKLLEAAEKLAANPDITNETRSQLREAKTAVAKAQSLAEKKPVDWLAIYGLCLVVLAMLSEFESGVEEDRERVQEAKRDLERLPGLIARAEKRTSHKDVRKSTRNLVERAKNKYQQARTTSRSAPINWFVVAALVVAAMELLEQAEDNAESNREDAYDARHDGGYYSSSSSSSWSSSSSHDSDSGGGGFGGFSGGGGSFGGGGASGSW